MTQYIGVVGYPLKHSISPVFQQAALDYYKLDIYYKAWETGLEDLLPLIDRLRQPQTLGANVTVPYKEAILNVIDEVDNLARLVGAVNTIVNKDGKLTGFNTDVYGFLRALHEDAKFKPEDKKVIILGAGGVARAVSFSLLREKLQSLTIVNRTLERAEALVDDLDKYTTDEKIHVKVNALSGHDSKFRQAIKHCHLVVNCTTLGMKYSLEEEQSPLTLDLIPNSALVYDLVYNPLETPLLRIAKEAGAKTIGGLPMLIYQGAASFEMWTGREAPLDIMFSAAKKAFSGMEG